MSEETPARQKSRSASWIARTVLTGVILVCLVCTGLIVPIVQLGWYLTTGWFTLLLRSSREMSIRPASLIWFAVSVMLLAILAHRMTVWFLSHRSAAPSTESTFPANGFWPVRASVLLLLMLLNSFLAGICLVGIMHEATWIATAKEPLMEMGSGFRRSVSRTRSRNNLEQVALALHDHHGAQESFPAAMTFTKQGAALHGWVAPLLPYLDRKAIYDAIRFDLPWRDAHHRAVFQTSIPLLIHPLLHDQQHNDNDDALSHYAGNSLVLQPGHARPLAEITDGSSKTIMAGEVIDRLEPWGKPGNCRDPRLGINRSERGFRSPSNGGANFLMVDGSVQFISEKIDPRVLEAIATPNGGESTDGF